MVVAVLAAAGILLLARGSTSESGDAEDAAIAYMRAQVSTDPKACNFMTDEMQQQWIDNVTRSFEPDTTPATCDAATRVFVEWGNANDQIWPDASDVKITAKSIEVSGGEATVTLLVELSDTNRTESTLRLARVGDRWLVSGLDPAS